MIIINTKLNFKNKIISLIKKNKYKKIFILTGKKSFKSFKEHLYLPLVSSQSRLEIYFKKKNNIYPEYKELRYLIEKINKFNPDVILAIGGGTIIDYAKLANVFSNKKKIIYNILKNNVFINSKKTKLIVIPTTAGSGSEATRFAVLYINKKKYSLESNFIIPDYIFLVPNIIINLSKKNKASSGFDSIAQSIECLFSKRSNKKSVKYSLLSLHYSLKYFISFIEKPTLANAKKMCLASYYSGKAINIAKTNLPHSLSYFFTSHLRIPHGQAVSLFFLKILKFYYSNINNFNKNSTINSRFKLLFRITKTENIHQLLFYLKTIIEKAKLTLTIKKLENNSFLRKVVKSINKERLNNCLVDPTKDDILNILSSKKI